MALTPAERQARARAKRKLMAVSSGPGGVDRLSELVMAQVKQLVEAGELIPSIKDGLTAERIIDSRIAKQDDRILALAMARLLAGGTGGYTAPLALIEDGMTIEGEFEAVDDTVIIPD